MKIGPVDPEIALLNFKKMKEINASKIDSPSGKFAERAKQEALLRQRDRATRLSVEIL